MAIFLSCQHISFVLANGFTLFKDINFSLSTGKKYGLIGKNGVGKSTLLDILAGKTLPTEGQIICHECLEYLPQKLSPSAQTVIESLGKAEEYAAYLKVEAGVGTMADFEILELQWDFYSRIQEELANFDLNHIQPLEDYSHLSGGEKVRLALVRIFLSQNNLLLLDEPTNNLDYYTKNLLIERIKNYKGILLIVSHDRELLEKMDCILELKQEKIEVYGGSFSFYLQEKDHANLLLEKKKEEIKKEISQLVITTQAIQKQQATREKAGKKKVATKKLMPSVGKGRLEKAEISQGKSNIKREKKKEEIQQKQKELEKQIEKESFINIPVLTEKTNTSQRIIKVENLNFKYPNSKKYICKDLDLIVLAGERIAFEGKSGAGKSTLLKLLMGQLKPNLGNVLVSQSFSILDQNLSIINPNLSVLENGLFHNSESSIQDIRYALGRFRFRGDTVEKKASILSGGERVKLALACILGIKMPAVLFLDEPTNNLDLESLELLEESLKNYQGTYILVSHDTHFKKALNLTSSYTLENGILKKA